jgi:hypothetical protein
MANREDYTKYFAARDADYVANTLLGRAEQYYNQIDSNGYLDKLRMMWAAYHGAYYTDFDDGHYIVFSGEQGEIANIAINHLRNLAQHMIVMITANRPSFKARATNTDHKSLVQAKLADGLLDYYLREKTLEDYLKKAVEYAVVFGSGFIKMEWNAMSGEEAYDTDPETGEEIWEGDVEFSNLSPFDVIFDSNREDNKHDWVLCRSFKNRFDLVAKYPEYEEEILRLPSKSELQSFHLESFHYDKTDLIPVYEFYHKRSEAVPDGRYTLFLSDNVVLSDGPMPYRDLPVYRISPAEILGTPFGYTPLFDILPIQDAINSLYSTVLTNQNAFGIQNLLVPRGADVNIEALSGGLNVIEANTSAGKVEALNLTQTPKEIFEFMQMLEQVAETISGINSVARGNPESSLKSGNALALVQSMSLQFMSGLQQSYVSMIEKVGTGLINMLRDFADVPRVAMIAGDRNSTFMKEFTGDDLSSVNRVVVEVANPLAKTTAGRVQMAEQMLQMGIIKTPEQYISIINTGNLDVMTEDTQSHLFLIRKENENLTAGKRVIAVATDPHSLHIREHQAVLADPDLRMDPDLVQRTLDHMQEHIGLLRTTDPELLMILQEQPLGPPGGSPANQPGPPMPPDGAMGQTGELQNLPPQGASPGTPQAGTPEPAKPPAPFDTMPTNPADMMPE